MNVELVDWSMGQASTAYLSSCCHHGNRTESNSWLLV